MVQSGSSVGDREVHTEGKRDLSPRDRPPSQVCYLLDLQHCIILSLSFPLCERDSSNTCFVGEGCCNNQMKGKGLAHCVHRCLARFLRGHLWDQFWLRWGTPCLLNASIVRMLLPLIQLHVISTMFPFSNWFQSVCHPHDNDSDVHGLWLSLFHKVQQNVQIGAFEEPSFRLPI